MKEKKDYYFPVLLCQILLSALAVILIFLTGGASREFISELESVLTDNRQGEEISRSKLNYYTKSLYKYVAEVYGWKGGGK